MRPGPAGGIAGLFAGAAALGVVHLMSPLVLTSAVLAAAARNGVDPEVSFGVAYATAAAAGALVGAVFAKITRYLRRFFPLMLWSVVFFASLTMLLLAASRTYGTGFGVALAPTILAASAVFGLVLAFSLPIRRRG